VLIHQDASLYAALLDGEDQATHALQAGRLGYVHVIRGRVEVNGVALNTGDALKIADEASVSFARAEAAELLLFDLPR
jgi:redox-sensitive bicupin YhaK (pirin superfamily)